MAERFDIMRAAIAPEARLRRCLVVLGLACFLGWPAGPDPLAQPRLMKEDPLPRLACLCLRVGVHHRLGDIGNQYDVGGLRELRNRAQDCRKAEDDKAGR